MFGRFKSKAPPPLPTPPAWEIRDTLFGDAPLSQWPPGVGGNDAEPWRSFIAARTAVAEGRVADAVPVWQRITQMPGLESRHYTQAWHFLSEQGVLVPPEKAKQLLGVVLEVSVNGGLDLLAAYPERTARYYNYTGRGVIWEHPNASLDPLIDALLAAGQQVLDQIGPWEKPRPPAPPAEHIRLNLLSPAGLHFGQGPLQVLANDPRAKPMIDAGVMLMQALINLGSPPVK